MVNIPDWRLDMWEVFLSPLLVAIIVIVIGWFIGNRITTDWNLKQKRRETDIDNLQQFYSLYGEFKEMCKIWRVIKKDLIEKKWI